MPRRSVPVLDDEQRRDALRKAAETRHARAELCKDIKAGRKSVVEVLGMDDPLVSKMRVRALLRSVPGYGKVKSARLMEEIGIPENRRVGGLGVRQRAALLEVLGS